MGQKKEIPTPAPVPVSKKNTGGYRTWIAPTSDSSTERDSRFDVLFSKQDIDDYHIPSLAGHLNPAKYKDDMENNPQETLLKMIGQFPNDLELSIRRNQWPIDNDYKQRKYTRLFHIYYKGYVPLAMFPPNLVKLTKGERAALRIGEDFNTLSKKMNRLWKPVVSIDNELPHNYDNNPFSPFVRAYKWVGRKLRGDQTFQLCNNLADYNRHEIEELEDKAAKAIATARKEGKPLTEIPTEILQEKNKLLEKGKALIEEAQRVIAKAKAEKIPFDEGDDEQRAA